MRTLQVNMIQTSDEKGMNHPLTIQISQELDRLINEYMKLRQEK
ncbi:aspartyl-phosphate phosphatase Spo0E family protein [Virgibacillus halophilus]|uniref:Aspartyl-phosphate phosphatase Spo0E family protein n=2 Tax=Tigheibacillus halophilus TaxID=361280 RepID=A0ABU5C8E7_9BACI|nr:aspartyl-phosphate phosphatase Spo0E family protein [Virgibacillus halophilus]